MKRDDALAKMPANENNLKSLQKQILDQQSEIPDLNKKVIEL